MKYFILLLSLSSLLLVSCFSDSCGLFGATSTYGSKIIHTNELPNLTLNIGEVYTFKPSEYYYIQYTYTGSESCDGDDYVDHARIDDDYAYFTSDSIAFFDFRWNGGPENQEIDIQAINIGSTTAVFPFDWATESTTDAFYQYDTLRVSIVVQN